MLLSSARLQRWGAVLGLLLVAAVEGQGNYRPEVATKYGLLRGKLASVEGTSQPVNVFLGIPFARPPVGALRFSPPQPPEPWSHVREATSNPPICLQDLGWTDTFRKMMKGDFFNLPVSEDCLYLNVFTPDLKAKLPVMVWIHGGGLIVGAASMLDGSALSAYEHVVVVMIQYRLGLPGFFSTGSKDARGNWGLLDQTAALQWVQENIELFGGDPHSVTIFGESAGGFCASAHTLSPLSRGLFHRAISESGVVLLPSLFTKNPEAIVQRVANISGCEVSGAAALVSCLRSKTEEELHALNTQVTLEIGIVPAVIDGEFILKDPEELLAKMELNAVPYLSGVNNHEYGWVISQALNFSGITEGMDREAITAAFRQTASVLGIPLESVQMILDEYLGDTEDPTKLRERFQDFMGDIMFVIPALQTARYHRDAGAPVYFYEYQHPPTVFKDLRPDFVKADHADELGFVFGAPFLGNDTISFGEFTEKEKELSRTIMKYWGNFAYNGNPNGKGLVEWPRYDMNEEYLELNLVQKKARKLKNNKVDFWLKTLPEKMKKIIQEPQIHVDL
ncbi:fatty acyl-CoA hydrolase precursor, medium chain [Pogona vitticeps]